MASRSNRNMSAARHIQHELDHGHFEGKLPKIPKFIVVREPPFRIDSVNWTDPDTGEVVKEGPFLVDNNFPYQTGTLDEENTLQ